MRLGPPNPWKSWCAVHNIPRQEGHRIGLSQKIRVYHLITMMFAQFLHSEGYMNNKVNLLNSDLICILWGNILKLENYLILIQLAPSSFSIIDASCLNLRFFWWLSNGDFNLIISSLFISWYSTGESFFLSPIYLLIHLIFLSIYTERFHFLIQNVTIHYDHYLFCAQLALDMIT